MIPVTQYCKWFLLDSDSDSDSGSVDLDLDSISGSVDSDSGLMDSDSDSGLVDSDSLLDSLVWTFFNTAEYEWILRNHSQTLILFGFGENIGEV